MHYIDTNTLNPYIRVAQHSIIPQGHRVCRRAIFDYELIFIESGSMVLNYNGQDYHCDAGQFILLHPGISHYIPPIAQDLSQPHIHFDLLYNANSTVTPISFKDLDQFSDEELRIIQDDLLTNSSPSPFVTFSDPAAATDAFFRTIECYQKKRSILAKSAFFELLDHLITDNFPSCFTQGKEYSIACQIKDLIDFGQGINMNLEDFEKQFAYSRYYLEKRFREKYGISLIRYRNQKKIQLACKLLGEMSVSAVTAELSFSSIYAFSRAFKKQTGQTPSEYTQSLRRDQ